MQFSLILLEEKVFPPRIMEYSQRDAGWGLKPAAHKKMIIQGKVVEARMAIDVLSIDNL